MMNGDVRFMILREDANLVILRSIESSARIAPPNIGIPDITRYVLDFAKNLPKPKYQDMN